MLLVHLEHILIDFPQSRRDRHHLGSAKFLRNLSHHHLNLLVDELSRFERGHALLEHHSDERQSESRHRANLGDIHDIAHRYFHRHGDELLHLLWGQRGRHGYDLHLIVRYIRHCIYG